MCLGSAFRVFAAISVILGVFAAGCSTPVVAPAPAPSADALAQAPAPPAAKPPSKPLPPLTLPADWSTMPPVKFEREILRWTPAGERRAVSRAQIDELSHALASGGAPAVRAALILVRAGSPDVGGVLLDSLERRTEDAAAVIAARGFTFGARARDDAARLERLAVGSAPGSDLEVRVECAASALFLGRDTVQPWLISVLRIGLAPKSAPLAAGAADEDAVARAQRRAAAALARRLDTDARFEPYASAVVRAEEADRLEALVRTTPRRR